MIRQFFIIAACASIIEAEPLSVDNGFASDCFRVIENTSQMSRQSGFPVGFSTSIKSEENKKEFSGGFTYSRNKAAFGFAYHHDSAGIFNTITGLNADFGKITAGFSFDFRFIDTDAYMGMSFAGSWFFNEEKNISLIFKNGILTDDYYKETPRGLFIQTSGSSEKINGFYYSIAGGVQSYTKQIDMKNYNFGINGKIEKTVTINPQLSTLIEGSIFSDGKGTIKSVVGGFLGFSLKRRDNKTGIYCGYSREIEKKSGALRALLFINPAARIHSPKLHCSILLDTTKISPNGDGNSDILFIKPTGVFKDRMINVKEWTIIVRSGKSNESEIVRSWFGGGLPPSSIVFNGLRNNGTTLPTGIYYVEMIIVDSYNASIHSEQKSLEIQ